MPRLENVQYPGYCHDTVPCGEPPNLTTLFMMSASGRSHGDQVQYQCLEDLQLVSGDTLAECQEGNWVWIPSGQPAVCADGKH